MPNNCTLNNVWKQNSEELFFTLREWKLFHSQCRVHLRKILSRVALEYYFFLLSRYSIMSEIYSRTIILKGTRPLTRKYSILKDLSNIYLYIFSNFQFGERNAKQSKETYLISFNFTKEKRIPPFKHTFKCKSNFY